MNRYTTIRGAAQVAEIRYATLLGREHLVVPVVAMVGNSVVRPMNSKGAEFVPAEELAVAPAIWDRKPVVPDHPGNGAASACTPEILEAMEFGLMLNTKFEDGRLKTEAWLDVERARQLGGDPWRVVERCQAGEMVEVSVGAWITARKEPGTYNGQRYEWVWAGVGADHLAMLPEDAVGACSVDMGCGAPRINRRAELRAAQEASMSKRSMIGRVLEALGLRAAQDEDSTVSELFEALWKALRAEVPGFEEIEEISTDGQWVIYSATPESERLFFKRGYSDEGEDLTLADDPEPVQPVMRWESLREDEEDRAAEESACTCNSGKGQAAPSQTEGADMSTKVKELVGRLITNERSPFAEDDRKWLEAASEERLKSLAKQCSEEPEPEPEPDEPEEVAEEQADPDTVQVSRDDFEDMRAATRAWKREQEAKKTHLVGMLKSAQDEYSEDDLKAMSVEQLEKTSRLLKLHRPEPTYLRNLPDEETGERKMRPLPDTYGIRKNQEQAAN